MWYVTMQLDDDTDSDGESLRIIRSISAMREGQGGGVVTGSAASSSSAGRKKTPDDMV